LAGSSYVEDMPEVSSSKPLACEFGYKKYLIRSFSATNGTFAEIIKLRTSMKLRMGLLHKFQRLSDGAIFIRAP
jgi:hypothetical protein